MQIAVLGAGSFGTAVAVALSRTDMKVSLWSRNERVVESIRSSRENAVYLPGYRVPEFVEITSDIVQVLRAASVAILSVPVQELRNLCTLVQYSGILPDCVPLLICSKGIENGSLKFGGEVAEELFPQNPVFVLSGPTLAREIALGLPCSVVLAGRQKSAIESLASRLNTSKLSITSSTDTMGVQIGATLKNIVAIACGIIVGKNLGYNALATVVTRGMTEIEMLYVKKVGRVDTSTLMGFACLGDLVLTCTTRESRNMSFGMLIGQQNAVPRDNTKLVEGFSSSKAIAQLSSSLGIHLPICTTVFKLLHEGLSVEQAVQQILHLNPATVA